MILIPLENDEKTIAEGFRKAPKFVFLDAESGIVIQENHFKTDKSDIFFQNFEKYAVDIIYVRNMGYKTYLKLEELGINVFLVSSVECYTHIDPNELIQLNTDNAKEYCTMGHHNKEFD